MALLHANRRGRGLNRRRRVGGRQGVHGSLVSAACELPHLARRRLRRVDQPDLVHPLDPGAAIPPRNDQPYRLAVIERQRLAVHAHGEECAQRIERREREDPARPRNRRGRRRSGSTPLTRTAVAWGDGRNVSTTSSSGTPSHSATLMRPKLAGLLLPEHSSRCAPSGRARRMTSSSGTVDGLARRPDVLMVHGPWCAATAGGHSVRT